MKQKLTIREKKRAAILKAAIDLFLKHGYSVTTMDEIARTARVTKQTVYAHYTSKEQLFTHMVSDICERHTPASAQLAHKKATIEKQLAHIGHAFLEIMTSPEGLGATRLVIAESARHPELAKLYYDSGTQLLVQLLANFLKSQKKNKQLAITNPESAASYFLALLKGQYYVRMILGVKPVPSPKEKLAHVDEVVKIFMHLYGKKHPLTTRSTL